MRCLWFRTCSLRIIYGWWMSDQYLQPASQYSTNSCPAYSIENLCADWRSTNDSTVTQWWVRNDELLVWILFSIDFSFFQMPVSSNIERFLLKLSPKAKEAFAQISRTAQERLEGDQTKVNTLVTSSLCLLKNFIQIKRAQRQWQTVRQSLSEEERLKQRRERQVSRSSHSQ